MDESGKGVSLLEAPSDILELKLQVQEELDREREAAAQSARRAFACRVVAVGFAVLFIILFSFKVLSESADQRRSFSSSCMHALGGGSVGPRGSLLHFDPRCTEELKEYFDQAYYEEVRRVSDEAIAYFRQQITRHQQQEAAGAVAPGSSRGTVIFDIDETALSNMDGFFGGSSWSRLFVRESPNRCMRPHLEYANLEPLRLQLIGDTGQLAPVQPQRRPLCNSPPLRATLDLYNFLYDNNFTVVFLTGRSEDARSETEANLADAGYGKLCSHATTAPASTTGAETTTSASPYTTTTATTTATSTASEFAAAATASDPFADTERPRHRSRRQALQYNGGAAATTTTPTSTSSTSSSGLPFAGLLFSPPSAPPTSRCYTELLMRPVGDEGLASVVKSAARARLVAAGHVLVGNIGDQFSDLVGEAAAVANFKLPNPVYTLL